MVSLNDPFYDPNITHLECIMITKKSFLDDLMYIYNINTSYTHGGVEFDL